MYECINVCYIKTKLPQSSDTRVTMGVGHVMNVWRTWLTYWIFDVGNETSASLSITFSTLTLMTSSVYATLCMVDPRSYIFPKATNYVECWRCTCHTLISSGSTCVWSLNLVFSLRNPRNKHCCIIHKVSQHSKRKNKHRCVICKVLQRFGNK